MQTFLPFPEYGDTARCLRDIELGNQISHTLIILDTLHEVEGSEGWRKHPVMDMWRRHEAQLCAYGLAMCEEYSNRGHNVLSSEERINWHLANIATVDDFEMGKPPWMNSRALMSAVMRSSQANLLNRDKKHYSQYKWNVPPSADVYWPKSYEV